MSGVTGDQTISIVDVLKLYRDRLESLRADMLALHQQVECLSADFQSTLTTALAAIEPSHDEATPDLIDLVAAADAASTEDPEIGSEIEIFGEELASTRLSALSDAAMPGDDLTRIKGIDSAAAETLGGFGIRTYSELAAIDSDEAIAIGMVLGDADRISREGWVEQALVQSEPMAAQGNAEQHTTAAAIASLESPVAIETAATLEVVPETVEPQAIRHTVDPILDDIVIDQDATTRQLIMAAASLAQAIAAQKKRERLAAAQDKGADVIEIAVAAETAPATPIAIDSAAAATASAAATAGSAEIVDLAARRALTKKRTSRPRAIAASLVLLLLAGVAVGGSAEHILGVDFTALASCGEALLQGDASCVDLPASSL